MDSGGKSTRRPKRYDHPGMRCGQLDYIDKTDNRGTRSEVMPSNRREATQYDNPPTGVEPATEFVDDRM